MTVLEVKFTKLDQEQLGRLASRYRGVVTSPIFLGPQAVRIEFEHFGQAQICMKYIRRFPHLLGEDVEVELKPAAFL